MLYVGADPAPSSSQTSNMSDSLSPKSSYQGPALWSYGFRPFFLSAALFVAIAIPAWTWFLARAEGVPMQYLLRTWHVHEMVFGFLPCVITGFLLTAIPNWTERLPMRGRPLMLLWTLWFVGRLSIAFSDWAPLVLAVIDGAFLVVVAGVVWREILWAQAWDRLPMGVLVSLYACANLLFHVRFLQGVETDVAERMGLALIMILLAMIGGKIIPSFTEDYFEEKAVAKQPAPFSRFDGFSIVLLGVTGVAWMIAPEARACGSGVCVCGGVSSGSSEPLVWLAHVA